MPPLMEASALTKYYRHIKAVDGISFAVTRGECLGLLGPNGAGKTTTVEMLEGIKSPTGGAISYRGAPLGRRFRDEAGIMFQTTALQEFITVRETLQMFQRLYPRSTDMDKLVERCALEELLDRDNRRLSGGQRQRLLFAIALVNDPEIVFLDEPTTGLDPQARRRFWELVQEIKAMGKTVILTTHYMEEAYLLCDRILIIDHGKIIAQGTPRALLAAHFDDVILQLPAADVPHALGRLDHSQVSHHADTVEIMTSDVNDTIKQLIADGVSLSHLQVRPRSLEDLFLELTGRELRA